MGISLRPEHLKRYKNLAWLVLKYGRSDLLGQVGLDGVIREHERPPVSANPRVEELPRDLESLGPTYVKLGQFLSTRADMFPANYLEALERLQDRAEGVPFDEIELIVASELGVRLSKAFLEFDRVPLAAASLAQVHRARLRDGRVVAVKVQRPGVRRQIAMDLDALEDVVEFLDRHTHFGKRFMLLGTHEEFRRALLGELDFRMEALNLLTLRNNLQDYKLIQIPAPVEEYTTSRVLTMDYIKGEKVTNVSLERRLQVDGAVLAEELFKAYLRQFLIDGFYHADPHPGNVLLTEDGRIALVDVGMVGRVSERLQTELLRFLLALGERRGEEAYQCAIEIGDKTESFNPRILRKHIEDLIGIYERAALREIQLGRIFLDIVRMAGDSGIRFPSELAMLGKTLLNLDRIALALDPAFRPNEAVRRHAAQLFREKLKTSVSTSGFYEMLMDSREFIQLLPKRANKILEALAGNEFLIRLRTIDEKYLMTGLQKVANRLTIGIILAAVIVGAALMMHVKTPFMLFGYPGIAIIFFIIAVLGGGVLAFSILYHDERSRRKPKGPPR